MTKQLTIMFFPMDGHGHVNPCLSIARALKARGHRCLFGLDSVWKGKAAKYGFEEEIHFIKRDEEDKNEEFWVSFMAKNAYILRMQPIEKIEHFTAKTQLMMVETQKQRNDQYQAIIDKIKPDIVVVDNYVASAAETNSVAWVWLFTANQLMVIGDERLPPACSGLSVHDDPNEWKIFKQRYDELMEPVCKAASNAITEKGAPSLLPGRLHPESPYLNLYLCPKELDYDDIRPTPLKWHGFDTFILFPDEEPFQAPDCLKNLPGKLVYISLGTFTSSDFTLMTRVVDILKDSPNRFIVSKGPLADKYELPNNMWGERMLPQTKIIPTVDLVITHGGNNGLTESFYFGKPMIVMPLFGDQLDNAQRVHDKKFGIRLDPYKCTPEELLNAVETLLHDNDLKQRMKKASDRIKSADNLGRVAKLIESVVIKDE